MIPMVRTLGRQRMLEALSSSAVNRTGITHGMAAGGIGIRGRITDIGTGTLTGRRVDRQAVDQPYMATVMAGSAKPVRCPPFAFLTMSIETLTPPTRGKPLGIVPDLASRLAAVTGTAQALDVRRVEPTPWSLSCRDDVDAFGRGHDQPSLLTINAQWIAGEMGVT